MTESESSNQQNPLAQLNPDDHTRIIVLVYGTLDASKKFWCYVAVKPSAYKKFLEDQDNGKLDLFDFRPYGEIIISGEGHTPPDIVTKKVAEVYQTDPSKFFQPINPEEEVQKKMQALEDGLRDASSGSGSSGATAP